jgi:hypothetical protein
MTDSENSGDDSAVRPPRHIFVWRTFRGVPFQHHGVCLGDETVVHYADAAGRAAGPGGQRTAFRICRTELASFSPDGPARIHEVVHRRRLPTESVRRRALRSVGRAGVVGGGYELLRQNCEHFASWCVAGRFESRQVATAGERSIGVGAKLAAAATGQLAARRLMTRTMLAKALTRGSTPWLITADAVQWSTEALGHHAGLTDAEQRSRTGRWLGGGTAALIGLAGGPMGSCLAAGTWLVSEAVASGVSRYWTNRSNSAGG